MATSPKVTSSKCVFEKRIWVNYAWSHLKRTWRSKDYSGRSTSIRTQCHAKQHVLSSNTKLTVDDSTKRVLDNLLPFWIKSRIPTRIKQNILPKIKHLFNEQTALMKHRLRSNGKGLINQKQYTDKLESLFDISHASAYKLIKNEEDCEFL